MQRTILFVFLSVLFFSGCVSTLKQSPTFTQQMVTIKTVAVLPSDVRVYEMTAGGLTEEIDEWSQAAKQHIDQELKNQLQGKLGYTLKFIDEATVKSLNQDLWYRYKGLYGAVADEALSHSYPGPGYFEHKGKIFDYTLGTEIQEFSSLIGADALLFVSGFDFERSAGRVATEFFSTVAAACLGASIIYFHPTFLSMGLVDAETGDVLSFNVQAGTQEFSFRNPKHIAALTSQLSGKLFETPKEN